MIAWKYLNKPSATVAAMQEAQVDYYTRYIQSKPDE